MGRRFALVSSLVLCLSIGLLLATNPVLAQSPGPVAGWKVFFCSSLNHTYYFALLQNGDLYVRTTFPVSGGSLTLVGNFFQGTIVQPSAPIMYWEIVDRGGLSGDITVILENGDMYKRSVNFPELILGGMGGDEYVGNFWGEPPVPTSPGTWGSVKNKYEPKK
jgi:hypothetical protein